MTYKPCEELRLPSLYSDYLKRQVIADVLVPPAYAKSRRRYPLLLLNDGQDLGRLRLKATLSRLFQKQQIHELIVVAVHAGDRLQEYGITGHPDYQRRGSRARQYAQFISRELLPFLDQTFRLDLETAVNGVAGCSLGGLSALDLAWQFPQWFRCVGVFSGSLWWRSRPYGPNFDENRHRIAHLMIRNSTQRPGLRFWFQAGTHDETADRNNNGIIDAIDDTLDLITELVHKGYRPFRDVTYCEVLQGRHHPSTWAKVMPCFLQWGWGLKPRSCC
ncbi:MAG: esterase family protein [Chitinophagales bacterium]|nr:esterase family protein [Chitinophagales bacterium]MDW8428031.1 alpha/beta hydrolase-fold protein [Chitinophagales bacterium]